MRFTLAVVFLAALLLAGCGDYDSSDKPRGRSAAPEAVGVVVDPYSMGDPVKRPAQEKASAGRSKTRTPKASASKQPEGPVGDGSQPPPEGRVRERAASGAGKKGRYGLGVITVPLSTYWRAQERITYEAQVKHSLDLYRATHGSFPKTKEEFEEQILKPARIKLPELPEGHRYVYDPEKGELQVERPR
jgi:hypothetical protein